MQWVNMIRRHSNTENWSYTKPWPTKDTAVYVIFEDQKLRGQFSENLVFQISGFPFNLVVKFPKKKELWKFWKLKTKIWQKC